MNDIILSLSMAMFPIHSKGLLIFRVGISKFDLLMHIPAPEGEKNIEMNQFAFWNWLK